MASNVFVGNIPYQFIKEELLKTLSLVGPIKDFEIKQDEKTHSKGYGFCEYENPEIASSAIRNLNALDYKGRQLKIGRPDKNNTEVLSEKDNLMKKDIIYINDNNDINNEEKNNDKNNMNKNMNLTNILLGLSDEQKFLLLYTLKTLNSQDNNGFKELLNNQNEETINAILALQEDIIERFQDNNNK